MAKRKKQRYTKCPEPLNTFLDLAASATVGVITRHKILKDYEKGEGEASAKAALLVHGAGSLRSGSMGLIHLGGLWGTDSAIKTIQRREQQARAERAALEEKAMAPLVEPLTKCYSNNNQYAWRLNCEDGTEYGLDPVDFETRAEYNEALQEAKEDEEDYIESLPPVDECPSIGNENETFCFCRVSRLSDGKNMYYRANEEYAVGSTVLIPDDPSPTIAIVLSYEVHSANTIPVPLDDAEYIIGKV